MGELGQGKQYWFVIKELTKREIKRKYSRSSLGIVWSVLNPLLTMAVISMVFSQLFYRSIENYPIYFLTGNILWHFMTGCTNAAMTTLDDNRNMLIKVKFPQEVLVLARGYTALVNLGYSLLAYGLMLLVFGIAPKWTLLFYPVILFFLALFSLGISYILSIAYVFFGDIKHLYSVFLTLWMYCSALFYPVEGLQGFTRTVVLNNPMFNFINCARKVVMYGELPAIMEIISMIVWSLLLFFIGTAVFRKNRNKVMQKL